MWSSPLRGYTWERVALVLVALTVLTVVKPINTQDHTRLALSEAILRHGSLEIGRYVHHRGDFAVFDGRVYSDKAPGLSLFALPAAAISIAVPGHHAWAGTWRRWLMRLFVNGVPLLLLAALLGRAAEAELPGTGATVVVATGAGTLLGPLSTVLFDHVGTAFFLCLSFFLAARRRALAAGLAAGAAVLWEYEAALGVALIAILVARAGVPRLVPFVAGLLPATIVLAVYDTLAFGSPWHLSYRYVANDYARLQKQGFFGAGVPRERALHTVLLGGSGIRPGMGLLATSPVLLAGAYGLFRLWRLGRRAEALVCVLVAAAFVVWDAGYFAPYGGQSPGPRFAAPAIPFLLVGLPYALKRFPVPVLSIVVLSVALSVLVGLAWGTSDGVLPTSTPATVWSLLGAPRTVGMAICLVLGAACAAVAAAPYVASATTAEFDAGAVRSAH
jgi:hypothetical protein